MTTIATLPHGLTATMAVTLAACSGNEKCSRSGARTAPASPAVVLVKLPLRAKKRGELPA